MSAWLRWWKTPFGTAFWSAMLIVFIFWSGRPITFAFDPNEEKCLPDLHVAMLRHQKPQAPHAGDLVFWKPGGALAYVHQEFALKQVAAVGGDHVTIRGGQILVNGKLVATGLPLSGVYHRTPAQLERDDVVQPGRMFVIGTHPNSDDSRYWGDLDIKSVDGIAYKVF